MSTDYRGRRTRPPGPTLAPKKALDRRFVQSDWAAKGRIAGELPTCYCQRGLGHLLVSAARLDWGSRSTLGWQAAELTGYGSWIEGLQRR